MCGQFNEGLVAFIQEAHGTLSVPWKLLVVGARAEQHIQEAGLLIDETNRVPTSVQEIADLVEDLLPRVERWQSDAQLARLLVFYKIRISASSYQPKSLQLLPIGR